MYKTVYEWIRNKDNLSVHFEEYFDGDAYPVLVITMSINIPDSHEHMYSPLIVKERFDAVQIPNDDSSMIDILQSMYMSVINKFLGIKKANNNIRKD